MMCVQLPPLLVYREVNVRRVSHCLDHFWQLRIPTPTDKRIACAVHGITEVHEYERQSVGCTPDVLSAVRTVARATMLPLCVTGKLDAAYADPGW